MFVPRDGTPGRGDWSRADHGIHTSQSELFPENVAENEILMMLTGELWVAILLHKGTAEKKEAEPQRGAIGVHESLHP